MNTELTARERFEYDKRVLCPGDDFNATEIHARILVNAGRAKYKTRDMRAVEIAPTSDAAADDPADVGGKPKRGGRRYARRDMQADET